MFADSLPEVEPQDVAGGDHGQGIAVGLEHREVVAGVSVVGELVEHRDGVFVVVSDLVESVEGNLERVGVFEAPDAGGVVGVAAVQRDLGGFVYLVRALDLVELEDDRRLLARDEVRIRFGVDRLVFRRFDDRVVDPLDEPGVGHAELRIGFVFGIGTGATDLDKVAPAGGHLPTAHRVPDHLLVPSPYVDLPRFEELAEFVDAVSLDLQRFGRGPPPDELADDDDVRLVGDPHEVRQHRRLRPVPGTPRSRLRCRPWRFPIAVHGGTTPPTSRCCRPSYGSTSISYRTRSCIKSDTTYVVHLHHDELPLFVV